MHWPALHSECDDQVTFLDGLRISGARTWPSLADLRKKKKKAKQGWTWVVSGWETTLKFHDYTSLMESQKNIPREASKLLLYHCQENNVGAGVGFSQPYCRFARACWMPAVRACTLQWKLFCLCAEKKELTEILPECLLPIEMLYPYT